MKIPVAVCCYCHKYIPDSFHDFEEVCTCVDWHRIAKERGWKLKFPEEKEEVSK